jgi:DNA-binding PadR family transcriptional regulator
VNRLLILGAVRIFQPVHGYFVRRELLSWRAEQWAHLNPGSVYNALRTLTREGFLDEVGTEAEGGRPARTSYRLTGDGEAEFLKLLRPALWELEPYDPAKLLAAWSFAWVLTRKEVIAALQHRIEQITAHARSNEFALGDLKRVHETPDHVAEHVLLIQARLDGEAAWARGLVERLRAGAYWFDGEPDPPWPTSAVVAARP